MKYLYSIEKTINKTCKNHKRNSLIQARIGMRTNGDLHLGNIFPIISAVLIGEKLISLGFKYKLLVILVDQEISGNDLPFNLSRYSKKETLSEYSINIIKKFISELAPKDAKFILRYKLISKSQKTNLFKKLLIKIINNSKRIIPINTLCKKNRRLLTRYKKNGSKLKYYCKHCQFTHNLNLKDTNKEIMLDHDLLGAIENNLLNIDIHVLGLDHEIKHQKETSMEKRERYQKIISNNSSHLTLLTPLLFLKNKKMSKSSHHGIFITEIKRFFGKKYIALLKKFVINNIDREKINIHSISEISN